MSSVRLSAETGFRLVETVAAMGILALAAIPLLQVTTDANRNAASLETRLLARTVAENELARTMASRTVLDAGVATGQVDQMGRTFVWTRTTAPAEIGQLQNFRIDVRPDNSDQVLASLISLKYVPTNLPGEATPQRPPEGNPG